MDEEIAGPVFDVPVELGKVREFARATFASGGPPGPDAVVPATFLTTADFWWSPKRSNPIFTLGFDIKRQLHGEIEYVFHGPPPRVGQRLTARTKLEKTYDKPGKRGGTMRFAVLVTEFRDESGTLVCEERSTVLETANSSGSGT